MYLLHSLHSSLDWVSMMFLVILVISHGYNRGLFRWPLVDIIASVAGDARGSTRVCISRQHVSRRNFYVLGLYVRVIQGCCDKLTDGFSSKAPGTWYMLFLVFIPGKPCPWSQDLLNGRVDQWNPCGFRHSTRRCCWLSTREGWSFEWIVDRRVDCI